MRSRKSHEGERGMKKIFSLLVLGTMTMNAQAGIDVVYGKDTRQDVYATKNALHVKLATSTAGMFHVSQFAVTANKNAFNITGAETLARSMNVCHGERFASQPTAASCSGFLVGEDTLITAGHCVIGIMPTIQQACKNFVWAFDYSMKSAGDDPTKGIKATDIYSCKTVVDAKLDAFNDYAVIKLDRKVVGRPALKYRTSGKVANSANLVVIGHPSGLPSKISSGGKVLKNEASTQFVTSLDTFQGNSGSAVFNAQTGMLEGILVQGKIDYRPSIASNPGSCLVVNKCDAQGIKCEKDEEGTPPGEVVTRITSLSASISKALAIK
jgi:V8-like Glu-specific endopeptidase